MQTQIRVPVKKLPDSNTEAQTQTDSESAGI